MGDLQGRRQPMGGDLAGRKGRHKLMNSRLQREKQTVSLMIGMYCKKHHSSKNGLCSDCLALRKYAEARTIKCQFGDQKPICSNCPVHCYKPEKREKIRTVMRFAGPKMIYRHPYLAVMHLLDEQKKFRN